MTFAIFFPEQVRQPPAPVRRSPASGNERYLQVDLAMNALTGGTRGAYDKFELDYWSAAATEAL